MGENNISGYRVQAKHSRSLIVIIVVSVISFIISSYYDVFENIAKFVHKHENWQLDEFITVLLILVLALIFYFVKRWRELVIMNSIIETKNHELQKAFHEIKQLKGILPICSSCKKIRDDKGYWHQVELYVHDHTEADFSHGICPECIKKLYPDLVGENGDIYPSS